MTSLTWLFSHESRDFVWNHFNELVIRDSEKRLIQFVAEFYSEPMEDRLNESDMDSDVIPMHYIQIFVNHFRKFLIVVSLDHVDYFTEMPFIVWSLLVVIRLQINALDHIDNQKSNKKRCKKLYLMHVFFTLENNW